MVQFMKQRKDRIPSSAQSFFDLRVAIWLMIAILLYELRLLSQINGFIEFRSSASLTLLDTLLAESYDYSTSVQMLSTESVFDAITQEHPIPTSPFDYSSIDEMNRRADRFPSVEHRLKVYMSNWYIPPCPDNEEGQVQFARTPLLTDNGVQSKSLLLQSIPYDVTYKETSTLTGKENGNSPLISTTFHRNSKFLLPEEWRLQQACNDARCRASRFDFVPPPKEQRSSSDLLMEEEDLSLLLQFSDAVAYHVEKSTEFHATPEYFPAVPVFRKYRWALDPADLQRITDDTEAAAATGTPLRFSPPRHCLDVGQERQMSGTTADPMARTGTLPMVGIHRDLDEAIFHEIAQADVSWAEKKNAAVYRGRTTTLANPGDRMATTGEDEGAFQMCLQVPQCQFVYRHGNSRIVDAKLITTDNDITSFHGVNMYADPISLNEMLQYKGIVLLGGEADVETINWSLFSNSVLLTPPPTVTSWTMEELLEPWVHYIPLAPDGSDVEEKVQWMLDHDAEAREIARRGHVWILDLVFHPDAAHEQRELHAAQFERYRAHFRERPSLLHTWERLRWEQYLYEMEERNGDM